MSNIAIIGAGAWGTALSIACNSSDNNILLWSRNQKVVDDINKNHINQTYLNSIEIDKDIKATNDLTKIKNCDILLLVLPTQTLRQNCKLLQEINIKEFIPIIICCKGVEKNTLSLPYDIVKESFPNNPIAILSGPNFADEIARKLPSGTSIACKDQKIGKNLTKILGNNIFRTYYTDDIITAQIAGAAKNVLAIACGISEGKNFGQNAKATLITRGIDEISKLCIAMGGKRETLMELCGIGDIMLTCGSSKSRNMSLGIELGKGKKLDDILKDRVYVTEGVHSCQSITHLSNKLNIELPICEAVNSLIHKNANLDQTINNLLNRKNNIQ